MLPVCNWLSDHLLVLKGEVQMAQFLVCETGTFPTPSPPPEKACETGSFPIPFPPPPQKSTNGHEFQRTLLQILFLIRTL